MENILFVLHGSLVSELQQLLLFTFLNSSTHPLSSVSADKLKVHHADFDQIIYLFLLHLYFRLPFIIHVNIVIMIVIIIFLIILHLARVGEL